MKIKVNNGHEAFLRTLFVLLTWYAVSAFTLMIIEGASGKGAVEGQAALVTGISSLILIPVFILLDKRWNIGREGRRKAEEKAVGKKEHPVRRVSFLLVSALCGVCLSFLYGWTTDLIRLTERFSNQTQEKLLAASPLVLVIALGFLSPLAEELLFRRLIFGNLRRVFSKAPAMLITAGLFALCHGNVIQMLYAFPMGIFLQVLYLKDEKIGLPLACHMGSNLAAVLTESLLHGL